MFTIDVTGSVDRTTKNPRPKDFGYIQQFIKNIAPAFNISILETQVGVLTFSKVTHIQTELTPNRKVFEIEKPLLQGKSKNKSSLNHNR